MLRILWCSDRITGFSAYSKVSFETLTRLSKDGYVVAHVPMGRANRMGKWVYKGILILPSGESPFAEDVVLKHYTEFKADLLITLKDVWLFNIIHKYAINFCPIVPIDHSPVSPSITSRLHTAFRVIVISRFGQRELKYADIESHYIPHGVDTSVFRPLPEYKKECKKLWFLPEDDFTVLIVARNQARKLIARQLRIYKRFLECNPDIKSHLFLWSSVKPPTTPTETYGVADVGVNLLPEIMNLDLGEKVLWPDEELIKEGIPDWTGLNFKGGWDLVKLYNASDVILLCSGGEGAGIPLLEGASCGVPGVTIDYAASPEYVGPGLTVPPCDYIIMNTPGTRYALVDIDRGAEALTKILNSDWEKLSRKCRRFAERFDHKNIIERFWKPFLRECEEELYPYIAKNKVGSWA